MKKAVIVTRVLTNKVNNEILNLIENQDLNVGEIASKTNKVHCDISTRLRTLRKLELVNFKRKGKFVVYSQNGEKVRNYKDLISQF